MAQTKESTKPIDLTHVIETLELLRGEVRQVHECLRGHSKALLTVEEVAEVTARAPYTIRSWIKQGKLSAIRVAGTGPRGRLLIPRAELERLVEAGLGKKIPPSVLVGESA